MAPTCATTGASTGARCATCSAPATSSTSGTPTPRPPVKRLGDKVSYHNDGLTRWGGGFAQLEGRFGKLTAFSSASGSITGYRRIDYFRPKVDGDWDRTAWGNFTGYTAKLGGNYNLTPTVNLFANAGWLSTAPKFDSVYHFDNSRYDPAFNEKVASFELGAGYLERGRFTGNANLYYTRWMDRSWPKSIYSDKLDQSFRFLLNGIDALHKGVELDLKARLHPVLELRGMVSLGDWEWLNDVDVTFSPEEDPEAVGSFQVYAGGLKVGDAAQKTLALSAALFPARGLYASLSLRRFMDHYARFDPANRTDPGDRRQSWRLPDYNLVDEPARGVEAARRRFRRRQDETAAARLQPARRALRLRRGRRGWGPRRGERPGLPRAAAALEHLAVVRLLSCERCRCCWQGLDLAGTGQFEVQSWNRLNPVNIVTAQIVTINPSSIDIGMRTRSPRRMARCITSEREGDQQQVVAVGPEPQQQERLLRVEQLAEQPEQRDADLQHPQQEHPLLVSLRGHRPDLAQEIEHYPPGAGGEHQQGREQGAEGAEHENVLGPPPQ